MSLALSVAPLATLTAPRAGAAGGPTVWILDATDRPFTSTTPPGWAPTAIELYAARGGYEAAQILVRSGSAQSGVSVTAGALSGPGGASIPAANITTRYEYNHPNIQKAGNVQNPPDGGIAYYDALMDNSPRSVAANTTYAAYYQVYVPAGQAPGVYTGSATVNSSLGAVTVPVSVTVYGVTIPPTSQSTFKMNNWFTSAGWDYSGTEAAIPAEYNVQMYDANWWTVETNIAANMARHRNNVIYADAVALLIPNTTVDAGGHFTFDWSTFDRFVNLFVNAGAMQYLYTPTLLEPPDSAPQLDTLVAANGVSGPVKHVLCQPNSGPANGCPDTNGWLNQFFPALKAHLDAKGWTNNFYMSALDEPTSAPQATAANWFYSLYEQYFPNPRTNEAQLTTFTGDAAHLSTQTPLSSNYDANVALYQNYRIGGKDLWLYTCILPQGTYMNRFTSNYLSGTRLLPWLTWKIGGDGYLHWGWNYWHDDFNPPYPGADTFNTPQTGDHWLVYPNKAGYGIYDSLRSEAQTAGLQDFELLQQLAAVKPQAARTLAETLVTNPSVYDTSGWNVEGRHKQLLDELAAAAGDLTLPFTDDFSGGDHFWTHTHGSWSTGGGTYAQSDASANWGDVSYLRGRGYSDVSAAVDLQITAVSPSGGSTNWAGLMVRSANGTDLDSGYLVAQRDNGQVFVYRSGTAIGSASVPGYVSGQRTHLRVVARGGTLTVYSGTGQAPVLTVTDQAFTAGAVGLVTGGASANFWNARVVPTSVDPAESSAVTASSSYEADGWGIRSAVDGQRTTVANAAGWSSSGSIGSNHTEWVRLDLGSTRSLSRIDLFPRSDGANAGQGFPVDFTVQTSTDGANWTTVSTQTGYPRPGATPQTFPFAAVNARYVKVTGTNLSTDQFGNYHMQFAEIEAVGGDLAPGRTAATSSSVEYPNEGWLTANLTNGAHHTDLWNSSGWSSAGSGSPNTTQWAQVNLGGPSRISQVTLYPRDDAPNTGLGFPSAFTIQTSPDGTNWTTVVSRSSYPRPGAGGLTFAFAATTARYVKVTGTTLTADQFGVYYMQLAGIGVS
ncbi:discoidin domain-containing protein [Kitasatospora sp. NPDC049285]|uniref:discoidin domain-containing protein n=1 Tax=Kitasatospora sp. NPDC049285 TaxID=3157096 RepID=UPI00343F896A